MTKYHVRSLIGIVAGVLIYIFLWPQRPSRTVPPRQEVEAETAAAAATNESPVGAVSRSSPPVAVSAPAQQSDAAVATQSSPNQDAEAAHLSVEQFEQKLRSRDFKEWLRESKKYTDARDASATELSISHEAGTFLVGGREYKFRYEWGGEGSVDDSCASLLPPEGNLRLGQWSAGTLTFLKPPLENAHIVAIGDRDYFVRYIDKTESRARDANGIPNPILNTFMIYYFHKNAVGEFTYRGKLAKLTWPDTEQKLSGLNFCQNSFGPEE